MRTSTTFLIGIIISLSAKTQVKPCELISLMNDSVKFKMQIVTAKAGEKHHPNGPFFVQMHLSNDQIDCLLHQDSAFWIIRLKDSTSDWGSNIVLHYIYHREASIIAGFNNREKWLKVKSGQIEYWKNFFSKAKYK